MSIFNEIHLRNLRGDILGGVTAAVVALPMALAFGVASGTGAEVGLYGAIMVGLFAALFGGSPTLISEPTGPMTVVFTAVIAKLIASNPDNGLAMAFTVVVMAGLFQILFGILRLGKYVTLMPYSVVSGFMSGIGIILIVLQLGPLLGQATPAGGVIGAFENIPEIINGARVPEILLGLTTIFILFFWPAKLKRYAPPPLLALVVGTVLSVMLLGTDDVRRIGEIPSGLPEFQMPVFTGEQWNVMLLDAIVLGMLGSIDALLTSVIADSLTRKQHNSDKELIGQGVGNMMSGLFGGLPGAGATMGTVVNIQTGAQTALSGLVRVAILIIIVMWLSGLTAVIPLAVLAGIALKVGIDIIDWSFLKRAHLLSLKGALITYGVILLTVFVDLIAAVGIGLFIANIMTITRLSELQETDVEVINSPKDAGDSLTDYEKDLLETANGKIMILLLKGAMIFGVSRAISSKNSEIQGCDSLIIDISKVTHLGLSSALAIEASIKDMLHTGKNIYIVHAEGQPIERLHKMGILSAVPEKKLLGNRRKAMEFAIYGSDQNTNAGVSVTRDTKTMQTG
jgi:SulP family sulfate permease